jgi:NAD(P)-dependent dehydrogenase (short-subunit alcohol dehydrogenase family)
MTNDVSRKVCVVTGASSGIGLETARVLARQGATVIMGSRGSGSGAQVADQVAKETGSKTVHFMPVDLSSMNDIRRFATELKSGYSQVDVLINNAGIYVSNYTETADGYELTFALNHLGYFLLTHELLGILQQARGARVINVSSEASRMGKIYFDDPMLKERYNGWRAYAQSKLANLMFTFALARRLQGTTVTVNALHPGTVATGFAQNETTTGLSRLVFRLLRPFFRSAEKGAETVIYLASADINGGTGQYFKDKVPLQAVRAAYDEASQERLWQLSERLTNIS